MAIRFINILKDLILETSRFEFIYNKYTKNKEGNSDEIPIDTLIELINSDPTSKIPEKINKENLTTQDMESIRVGKYAQWIIKNYVYSENKDLFLEDLYKVTGDLMKFERFKNRLPQEYRDINKLTVDELYNQVKDFSLEKTKASTEEKKEASKTYQHPGGEIVYRGSQWTVVRISNQGQLGKDAACFYGGYHLEPQKGETRWCTSSPGLNFFEKYIKDGPLYVVIPNSPRKFTGDMEVGEKTGLPALRYQFHFPSNQFMDPADKKIKISDFINQNPEFKELFKEDFLKNIIKNNNDNEIVISELNNNLDFIKTYGINEYLDKINKNIKTFKYIPFRENIIINFEKIGNFENLEEVKINNGGLETIPSSFCNLKNLKVLDLKGNPKIKTIPECFSQLPNLKLIYIGNTDDLIIPEKIKEKSDITKNIISFEKENFDFVKDKTKNKILNIFFKFGLEETGFDFKTLAQTLGIKTPEQYLDLFKNIKTEKQKGGYHFYFYSNNILMTYDEYSKILYVNTDKFYGMFSKAFGLEYKQSSDMMKNWMENKYGVKPDVIATAFDGNFNK